MQGGTERLLSDSEPIRDSAICFCVLSKDDRVMKSLKQESVDS